MGQLGEDLSGNGAEQVVGQVQSLQLAQAGQGINMDTADGVVA